MPSNIADRFSKIPKLTTDLTGEELLIVSKQTVPKKTHNAKTETLREFHTARARADNVDSIVSFGGGIKGTGKPANPLQLDADWLSGLYLRVPSNLAITSVGDRVTRYLPISRKTLFTHNYIDTTFKSNQPPSVTLEPTGELRVTAPGRSSTLHVSYGRWSVDKDLKSEQIIERGIRPSEGLPIGDGNNNLYDYEILEVFGSSASAALVLGQTISTGEKNLYYYTITDGSLAERSFTNGYLIGTATSAIGQKILKGSCVVFSNSAGAFLMVLSNSGNASAPLDVEVFTLTLNDTIDVVTMTKRSGWTINSYVGLSSGQTDLRLFDAFLGASTAKVALVNDGTHTASLTAPVGNKSQFIQIQQDPNNYDDITLYFRGYALISKGSNKFKYNYDIAYKLTLTRTAASAVALPSYLGNKPTLTAASTINNLRNTIVNHPDNLNPEHLKVLRDGSIVTGLVNGTDTTEPLRIHASRVGMVGFSENDVSSNLAAGKVGPAQILNFKPGYGNDISTKYKVYIASPIQYLMGNGGRGVISPRIVDMSGYAGGSNPLKEIGELPYVGNKFRGLRGWPVHMYIQHTGATGILLLSAGTIPEADVSTYIATIWFLEDGVNSILTQQAFSRLYKHRQSYRPRGMSVPVSYDNPAEPPNRFWLTKEAVAGQGEDSRATLLLTSLHTREGHFVIPAGYRARIWAVGGGGGGGGSIHNYSSAQYNAPRDGFPGEDTLFGLTSDFTANTFTCGGGQGGVGANWGNGSSFSNGVAGAGGTFKQTITDNRFLILGTVIGETPPIGSRWVQQVGGHSPYENTLPYNHDGHGGLGAWGVGDERWSYGGGGGGAAGVNTIFSNNSSNDVSMYYRVGAAGLGRVLPTAVTNGNPGGNGGGGFILVELERM